MFTNDFDNDDLMQEQIDMIFQFEEEQKAFQKDLKYPVVFEVENIEDMFNKKDDYDCLDYVKTKNIIEEDITIEQVNNHLRDIKRQYDSIVSSSIKRSIKHLYGYIEIDNVLNYINTVIRNTKGITSFKKEQIDSIILDAYINSGCNSYLRQNALNEAQIDSNETYTEDSINIEITNIIEQKETMTKLTTAIEPQYNNYPEFIENNFSDIDYTHTVTNDNLIEKTYIDKYEVLIPSAIQIEGKDSFKQQCYMFLEYISNALIYRNNINDDGEMSFISVNYKRATEMINGHIYTQMVKYLIENDIIEKNDTFRVGSESKSYRFTKSILKKSSDSDTFFRRQDITSIPLLKKINKLHQSYLKRVCADDQLNEQYQQLKHLRVRYVEAREYILESYPPVNSVNKIRRDCHLASITRIVNRNFYCTKDNYSGRIHTNFTSLKSDLRKFCYFENKRKEELYSSDVSNAQCSFLSLIAKSVMSKLENPLHKMVMDCLEECEVDFSNLVNTFKYKDDFKIFIEKSQDGTLYEYMMDTMEKNRDEVKINLMYVFYSHRFYAFKKEKEQFNNVFPTVYKFIKNIGIEVLPKLLQKIETKFIQSLADKVRNDEYKFSFLTVHDSIYYTEDIKEIVIKELNQYSDHFNIKTEKV